MGNRPDEAGRELRRSARRAWHAGAAAGAIESCYRACGAGSAGQEQHLTAAYGPGQRRWERDSRIKDLQRLAAREVDAGADVCRDCGQDDRARDLVQLDLYLRLRCRLESTSWWMSAGCINSLANVRFLVESCSWTLQAVERGRLRRFDACRAAQRQKTE